MIRYLPAKSRSLTGAAVLVGERERAADARPASGGGGRAADEQPARKQAKQQRGRRKVSGEALFVHDSPSLALLWRRRSSRINERVT